MPTDEGAEVIKPDPSTGDSADDNDGKTYTREEMKEFAEAKLRGQGKALAEAQAKLDALTAEQDKAKKKAEEAKRKKMEADGDVKGQLELERAEKAKLAEDLEKYKGQVNSFQEREMARLEVLKADNEKRLKALPKNLRELATDDDQDRMAARLSRAETLAGSGSPVEVRGGAGRGGGGGSTYEDRAAKRQNSSVTDFFPGAKQ